ncbi:murein DD-endopeptidase MepM/ murein hydrolase activator NlpD [Actinoplanes octamycinicus]|uniref:Murein DD-endopeptidase MepM/ murein hydrolase activator NlpD n=1 Tax=Actinoplanes octamycinicus TaxID=135948 RepID=A0A7W7MBE7_9ACTN|nr:M23 family metallopeptidase [Actinoplanes octamycinicus]MBB4743926.1 murein DD-endopeptidase MepM/ murein hydrolase activator NlpD [Actinoplanes octamycinicus]
MSARLLPALATGTTAALVLCLGGVTLLTTTATSASCPASTAAAADFGPQQRANAALIARVGASLHIPPRGQIIAVATALQESGLRNLGDLGARNDHDSLGLFQQRPSQGWGTPAQVRDPAYAATAFYQRLLTVPDWQTRPLTEVAQAVQRSAYPTAYAKWETAATALVAASAIGSASAGPACTTAWTKPVNGEVGSGFRTTERPGHDGVDLIAARGSPIRAAASGVVITVRCNAHRPNGTPYSCDVDGDPVTVLGCGWYAEIEHADHTVTRYCHMSHHPTVTVGQRVTTGQLIGEVGSSGHSSGPHLHLETHTEGPATEANAVEPTAFLHARGVDLNAE